nr:uncharacterized protein LOC113823954 [Penaeus vannamei]
MRTPMLSPRGESHRRQTVSLGRHPPASSRPDGTASLTRMWTSLLALGTRRQTRPWLQVAACVEGFLAFPRHSARSGHGARWESAGAGVLGKPSHETEQDPVPREVLVDKPPQVLRSRD